MERRFHRRLPAALHAAFLDIYLHNGLARGEVSLLGSPIDLTKVGCDTMVVAGRTDHLVPWRACYASCRLFGGPSEFVLTSSGHIQSLVNPPGSPRMTVATGADTDRSADEWIAESVEAPGVWWERWAEWQAVRAGRERRGSAIPGQPCQPSWGGGTRRLREGSLNAKVAPQPRWEISSTRGSARSTTAGAHAGVERRQASGGESRWALHGTRPAHAQRTVLGAGAVLHSEGR